MSTVLHILSQRPAKTGSGVTLDALVEGAARSGWSQHAVVGAPIDDPQPAVGGLPPERVHPLRFGESELDFPLPGMSDVMPYPSTVFSGMSAAQLAAYEAAWKNHLRDVIDKARPDVIHAHHLWLMGSWIKDVAPDIPVVSHCHATGFRQMELCGHLADAVKVRLRRNECFVVLHSAHARQLRETLVVDAGRIHVVGAGYREDLFHARGRAAPDRSALLYVGKYSSAKGLPWLLDAIEAIRADFPGLVLQVAGGGAGPEAEALQRRMNEMGATVRMHGQLSQAELADLMRVSHALALPSFYEGLPLVLVEAFACGCRLVATRLPGVMDALAGPLAPVLELVDLPPMAGIDRPDEKGLPAFVERLQGALRKTLEQPDLGDPSSRFGSELQAFGWNAVFRRIEKIWRSLI